MTEIVYSRVAEAEEMIKALCEKQPKLLWRVRPQTVAVYGNETKERPENKKEVAKIKCVKGVEKAIMQDNNIPIRYHIDIYWSDWRTWKENKKQGVLIHELLHIHEDVGKLIKHDIEDFSVLIDKTGAKMDRYDNFPNVLLEDVEFDLSLLPKTEEVEEEGDEIPEEEVEKKKRGRPKKIAEETEEGEEKKPVEDKSEGKEEGAEGEDNVF